MKTLHFLSNVTFEIRTTRKKAKKNLKNHSSLKLRAGEVVSCIERVWYWYWHPRGHLLLAVKVIRRSPDVNKTGSGSRGRQDAVQPLWPPDSVWWNRSSEALSPPTPGGGEGCPAARPMAGRPRGGGAPPPAGGGGGRVEMDTRWRWLSPTACRVTEQRFPRRFLGSRWKPTTEIHASTSDLACSSVLRTHFRWNTPHATCVEYYY